MTTYEWMTLAANIGGVLFAGGIVYGAIRADLRYTRQEAERAARLADKAHDRINALILRGKADG